MGKMPWQKDKIGLWGLEDMLYVRRTRGRLNATSNSLQLTPKRRKITKNVYELRRQYHIQELLTLQAAFWNDTGVLHYDAIVLLGVDKQRHRREGFCSDAQSVWKGLERATETHIYKESVAGMQFKLDKMKLASWQCTGNHPVSFLWCHSVYTAPAWLMPFTLCGPDTSHPHHLLHSVY